MTQQVEKFRIDSHKLHLHPRRVADWEAGTNVYPIYMEVSPAGACNHRCTFCGVDFMGYQSRKLATPMLEKLLPEMGRLGLKSIMYAGEGEPFLHPDMVQITEMTKAAGIDASFTTNATLLKPEKAERILPVTSWIKVSINAGTAATYAAVHKTRERDFDIVVENMRQAAEIRAKQGSKCTLGMQVVLLPENRGEVETLAKLARDIGMDYLVVKPYSQHTQSLTQLYKAVRYDEEAALAERLKAYDTDTFKVIVRLETMRKWDKNERPYKVCQALPFWSYIDAGGNVWGCSVYMRDERFLYGNVNDASFQAIWEGERRRKSLDFTHNELDISGCRQNCRMDEVNRYLWELKHPTEHVNFI
jgi:radical SAM protein with 4Fe4S-binding SPASM domain